MKSPIKDIDIGILHKDWGGNNKYRHVRHRAMDEYIERKRKAKKNKKISVPKYKPGDEVVVSTGYNHKEYFLVEILDFAENSSGVTFSYIGILKKTTDETASHRIGRLLECGENIWTFNIEPGVKESDLKWGNDARTNKSSK